MDIALELDVLANLKDELADLELRKLGVLAEQIPPEVQERLDAINAEFSPLIEAAQTNIAEAEDAIKGQVLDGGVSVKGERLQAVFNPGRITWDTKAMEGYRGSHPEIGPF